MNILVTEWIDFNGSPIDSDVHIFRLSLQKNLEKLSFYKTLLHARELSHSSRFYNAADRDRYIICRGVLKQLSAQYLQLSPELINIIPGENKKPILKDYPHLHFNISHSKNCMALAFSAESIGIDVEYVNPNFDYRAIAKACFTDAEINFLQTSCNPVKDFFKLWTRKESLLKADGKGLNDNMNKIDCLSEIRTPAYKNYCLTGFEIEQNYIACAAYKYPIKKIVFYDV